jgi:hypothetical protein
MNWYNVIVDFECNLYDHDVGDAFADAIHVEHIGPNQFQVGYAVHAPTEQQAFRLGVNLVEAKVATLDTGGIAWTDAEVYDE